MKAHTVDVAIPGISGASYPVIIQKGLLESIHTHLEPGRYAVITDANVADLYGKELARVLGEHDISTEIIVFEAGEKSKTRRTKETIEDTMLASMFDRSSKVIGLGGGVPGDIAGFTASTFMRGIPIIQIPTTLLAMVDSSVGGKTAVNHPLGKNLIGTFYQPEKVLIDPDTLGTLPEQDLLNGIAEIIKHGIIRDASLFGELEKNMESIKQGPPSFGWDGLIETNCRIKSAVVISDEKESGLRRILNFGHTVGHALETLSQGSMAHGEAVSIGMAAESAAARNMGLLEHSECERIVACITSSGLPASLPGTCDIDAVIQKTLHDKKTAGGTILYSLPDRIGNCLHGVEVADDDIRQALKEIRFAG